MSRLPGRRSAAPGMGRGRRRNSPPGNAEGGVLADAAPMHEVVPRASGLANVRRLQALGAARHVELDPLALGESLEAVALDRGEVDEHVFATRLGDEAKALRLVEPLHGATSHLKLLETGPGGPHYRAITLRLRPVTVTECPGSHAGLTKKPSVKSRTVLNAVPQFMVNRRQRQYRRVGADPQVKTRRS